MSAVAVFLDGNNFYNKLKALGVKNTPRFVYRGVVEWVASSRSLVYYSNSFFTLSTQHCSMLP
jgi:hypothetical protein